VALSGTGVVLTRRPHRQVLALAANGLVLAALFVALRAPDVAFAEIAVGAVAVPLLFLVALSSLRINPGPAQTDE
jgi:energy-converting hydrogenase B subunit D